MRKSPPVTETSLIGWQGLTLTVPLDWNIGVIGGDRQSGYLRIDGVMMPRMEIKWQQAGKGGVNLERTLDKFIQGFTKEIAKRKAPVNVERNVKLISKRQKRKGDVLGFHWTADHQAYGVLWHCPDCDRIVIAQVMGGLEEDLQPLAVKVLSSLEDHAHQGWDTWSVYGLEFQMPELFSLEKHKLLTGQLELEFTRKKTQRILVSRWAMADTLLKEGAFEEWMAYILRQRHGKEHRFTLKESTTRHGHAGLIFEGRIKPIIQRVKDASTRFVLRRKPPIIRVLAWHCAPSNKIFATHFFLPQEQERLVEEVTTSVACHDV
jgi:hypothetical protein